MPFLLDSNIVIALMAQREQVVQRVEQHEPGTLFVSTVVWFELMFGAFNSRRSQENRARLGNLEFPLLSFDEEDARQAGEIRAKLKSAGTPMGPYDVLIAGQALARELTLVTNNLREFARVDGLRLEDWTAA